MRSRVVLSQEHTAQRKVGAVEEQQKHLKKSWEIEVEETQVAEIKNKVQTVKNSLEVTNSSIKADTDDKCQCIQR